MNPRPKPKKSNPLITERGRPIGDGGERTSLGVRKAAVLTIAGFAVFLVGLFLAYGIPATLITGGAVAVVFGLVWESE